jgi:hypothetical protein
VERVHAEVSERAVGAVGLRAALPVDWLVRIEVARVQKERANLDRTSEAPLRDPAPHLLAAGEERHLRGAAHEQVGLGGDRAHDRLVGVEVHAERLLAKQVLARLQRRDVELGVEVVRHRDVDRLHLRIVEHGARIAGQRGCVGQPLVPCQRRGLDVAGVHETRAYTQVFEMDPARRGAGQLAAHQAAAYQAELDDALSHRPSPAPARPRRRRGGGA